MSVCIFLDIGIMLCIMNVITEKICKNCNKPKQYFTCQSCGYGPCGSYGCSELISPDMDYCEPCAQIICLCARGPKGKNRKCIECINHKDTIGYELETFDDFETVGIIGGREYCKAMQRFYEYK